MEMAKVHFGIRLEETTLAALKAAANLDRRPVSTYLSNLLDALVLNNVQQCSTMFNNVERCSTEEPKPKKPRKPKAEKIAAYKLPDKGGNERKAHPNFPTLYFSDLELERLTKIFQERGLKKEFQKYAFGKVEAWFTESPGGQKAYQASACHARRVADFGLDQALAKQQLDTKMYGKDKTAGATAILRNPYGHGVPE